MKTHFEKLERMYLGAKVNKRLFPSTTIDISEGAAIITFHVNSDYFHALEATHGSVYFKLLDDAAYFAANSLATDVFLLTTEFNIKMKRPFGEGLLIARGQMKSEDQGRLFASATLENEAGKLIAEGHGQFARSQSRLVPEIGYV